MFKVPILQILSSGGTKYLCAVANNVRQDIRVYLVYPTIIHFRYQAYYRIRLDIYARHGN